MTERDIIRFWSKIKRGHSTDCWLWNAGTFNDGYGSFWLRGKSYRAHRVAWALKNGVLSDDLDVLHECDTPLCCNPRHLFVGTKKDNAVDAKSKGRNVRGETVGTSKLKEHEVRYIRRIYALGITSQRSLAAHFNVCQATIWQIVNFNYWVAA